MGKCISKCFMIYQNKKSINSQQTIRTQTSARLQLQEINIQHQVKEYFQSYNSNRSIQWKDIMSVLKKQFYKYKDTNNNLSTDYWIEFMQRYQKFFFRKDDILELLNIVIWIVKKSTQNHNKQTQKQTLINSRKQIQNIGQKLFKFEQSLIKNHKASIQQLKFICQHEKQKQHQHHHNKQHCHKEYWTDFKFDMSEKQIQTVVMTVRAFAQNDINAFAFLTLYFQIGLQNKARQMKSKKLQEIYIQHLQRLIQKYPAKDVLLFNSLQPNIRLKQITNNQIELLQCRFSHNGVYHYDQLGQFLLQKCIKSKKDQDLLMQLMRDSCIDEQSLEVKLQQRKICQQENINTFNQTIIELLKNQDKYKDKFKNLKQVIGEKIKKLQKFSKLTIHHISKIEDEEIVKFLQNLLQNQQKVEMNINDMMKVKCYFINMGQLINATNKLVQTIENNQHYEVVFVQNRLNQIQKDVKVIVKLPYSIVSIYMILRLQSICNQFNIKLTQLKQTHPVYSPLSQQIRINNLYSNKFFTQLFQRYEHMSNYLITQSDNQQIAQLNSQLDLFQIKYLKPYNIIKQTNPHQSLQDITQIILMIKQIKQLLKSQSLNNKHIDVTQSQLKQQKVNQILLSYHIKHYNKAKQLIFKLQIQQIQNNKLLLQILADIYKQQNNLIQSLSYYQKSQKLYHSNKLTQTNQYIKLIQKIALIYQLLQNYKQSLQTYQQALLIKQKMYQPGSIKCAQTLFKIGKLYQKQQLYKDSNQFYKLSLQIHSQSSNQNSLQSAQILLSLGNVSQLRKRHDRAINCYEKCLKLYQIFYGNQSSLCASILDNLAASYLFKAEYKKSFQCYFKSLQIKQRIKGRNSIYYANTLSGIGSVYEKKDQYQPALKYYKQSLQIIQTCYGKQSIQCVKYLNNIIVVFYHQQKYEQALAYGLRCLQIQQKQKGKQSIDCSGTLFGLSLAYEKLGMKHQAYSVCRRAYRIRQKILGDQHSLTQQALNRGQYLIQRQNQNCLRDVFTF